MERYVPDMYFQSIFDIKYDKLKERGIKCVLFDLDNTIIPFGIKSLDDSTIELFKTIVELELNPVIFSNSPKGRVNFFKDMLGIDALASAKKPFKKNFFKIMNLYHLEENEIAIVGDQFLTDILGGNNVGFTTILVNPISAKEPIWTRVNRFFEGIVIKKLENKNLFIKDRYYD